MSQPAIKQETLDTLEYDSLVRLLVDYTQSPLGAARAARLSPGTDLAQIQLEQRRTAECVVYLGRAGLGLAGLPDPTAALAVLGIEDVNLEPSQILDLIRLIEAGLALRTQFAEVRGEYPALDGVFRQIPDLRTLLGQVQGKILPSGELDDNASAELRRIRREINQLRADIHRSLEGLMRRETHAIQDQIITVRNGRFVIPVRHDSRGKVPGVMHGVSSSGQTAFVEPLATIDDNNELVRLHELEMEEITKILFTLTGHLRGEAARLGQLSEALAEIDFVAAKARLAREFDCRAPEVHAGTTLAVEEGRHLLLERNLRAQGKPVVPISLELDRRSKSVMIISGPNAGGKTVVLKTVGLMALMAQSGLHVPARAARLPVFGQVLADIGDHQSIAANLSTFSAHMQNIRTIADVIGSAVTGADAVDATSAPALVLLDEVGTGTDPDEGAALGVAIVDHFKRKGAFVLASTHYNRLKMYAYNTPGVLNASVEFDEQTLRPTYRLLTDLAGASSGIEIARRLGLPGGMVDEAARLMSTKELDANEYLRRLKAHVDEQRELAGALAEERRALAAEYSRLELDFIKHERERSAEFEAELRRVAEEFARQSRGLVEQIQDRAQRLKLEKEQEKRAAELKRQMGEQLWRQRAESQQSLSQKLAKPILHKAGPPASGAGAAPPGEVGPVTAEPAPAAPGNLKPGDSVRVAGMGQAGVVEAIRGGQVEVRFGAMRLKVERRQVTALEPEKSVRKQVPAGLPKGVAVHLRDGDNVPRELNVIGCNVDEATTRTDKFLDDAFLSNLDSVRIIHGSGMGILRRALAEFLADHPHVAGFRPAPPNEGGNGATVVELRR